MNSNLDQQMSSSVDLGALMAKEIQSNIEELAALERSRLQAARGEFRWLQDDENDGSDTTEETP